VVLEMYELLRNLNRRLALILVSHDLSFVSRFVKQVVCVDRDVRVHPTSELTPERISEIYGGSIRVVRHDHQFVEEPGG